MEATTALLRIAARFSGAAAALVARTGDETPVAAWGCEPAAARALLRVVRGEPASAERFVRRIPLQLRDGTHGELLLAVPSINAEGRVLANLAAEIGAICDVAGEAEPSSAIERLIEGIEHLGDAVALLQIARDVRVAPIVLYVNAGFTRLFGYSAESVVGGPADVLWGAGTSDERLYWLRERMAAGENARMVVEFTTRDGTPLWTELSTVAVQTSDGPGLQVVTYRDVSARKQFEAALAAEKRKLQTTLAAIAEAVITVLPDGRVDYVNDAAQVLLGIDLVEAYGRDVHDVMQVIDAAGGAVELFARANEPVRGEGFLRSRAGGMIDVAYVASHIEGEPEGTVIVLRDITAEKGRAMQLSFEASHDALTGLENRRAFLEQLDDALRAARAHGQHHVVGFLDLDHFKVVNDRFGHATGDRLLREIGHVMGRVVRGGDVLARIGGDEFALLLSNCRMSDARRVAEKIREAVDAYRIEYAGQQLGVGVSVGLAPLDADSVDAEQALGEADAACYQAKAAGRNAIVG
ncbi:MAG TPA: diguanylate cyclase [Candidatus Sulfotelmatobacter sp.]|nr:diguanylate cyclase [Candidatus Sulfotelmatobacter sp.]